MSNITIRWYEKSQGVQLWYFQGKWTWEDYFETVRISNEMMFEYGPRRVDIICYMRETNHLPLNAINHVRSAALNRPDNWGLTVIVGGGAFVNMMVTIGRRVSPELENQYKTTDTLEEALLVIAEDRAQVSQV